MFLKDGAFIKSETTEDINYLISLDDGCEYLAKLWIVGNEMGCEQIGFGNVHHRKKIKQYYKSKYEHNNVTEIAYTIYKIDKERSRYVRKRSGKLKLAG